ncbi:nicastrin [Cimex lectularius]|uniref:Nicastrin n=1 Tax=Cimex lectularius TaxID=79782 RepID=A0A8I6TJU9_CIMLE|nr:nicastrin [Cimex lectularius]
MAHSEALKVFLTLFLYVSVSTSERQGVHEMMYQTLSGAAGCFRRMNGTHQFGCSSPRKGSFGVVQLVETDREVDFVLESAAAGPYMLVLSPKMIGLEVLKKLKSVPERVSGIVFTDRHNGKREFPSTYSPEDTCPNSAESSCNKENPWNPYGNSYIFTDWNVPFFLITEKSDYDTIVDCYKRFNLPLDDSQLSKPLCSLHMKSHMFAAVSSDVCMRRVNNHFVTPVKYCDPVGSENVALPIKADIAKNNKTIVIASRIDSASLFDGVAPGAMSAVTGLVTTLATASAIYNAVQSKKLSKNVLFVMFNGETFDYIGSSRVLYDIENKGFLTNSFRLNLEDIELFIDISQIGRPKNETGNEIFIHATGPEAKHFSKELIDNGVLFNASFVPSSIKELPPTSYTTFNKANPKMNGVVITNYDKAFKTKFYSGYYDTYETLDYTFMNGSVPDDSSIQYHIASVAASLVKTLLPIITDNNIPKNIYDLEDLMKRIDQVLLCYLVTRTCPLMEAVYPALASDPKLPQVLPLYVGVPHATNHMTKATGLLLSYFTSPQVNLSKSDCTSYDSNNLYTLLWLSGKNGDGVCLNTTLKFTPAISPAFLINDYDWTSGRYPTWTESVWDENSLSMFMKPSRRDEIIIFTTGVFTFLTTYVAVFFVKQKADNLFFPRYPTNC